MRKHRQTTTPPAAKATRGLDQLARADLGQSTQIKCLKCDQETNNTSTTYHGWPVCPACTQKLNKLIAKES
jgi:hypothetical protein